ncbi:unnamed protein product [Closterium sp. NIES-54]
MDEGVPEEIVLDENREAEGRSFFHIDSVVVSPNHGFVAYSLDTRGDERYSIHVRPICSGSAAAGAASAAASAILSSDVSEASVGKFSVPAESAAASEGAERVPEAAALRSAGSRTVPAAAERLTPVTPVTPVTEADTDVIPSEFGTSGEVCWAEDNQTLFYVAQDEKDRPCSVMRHVIGTPVSQDACVFFEKDEAFDVGIHRASSDRFIIITCGSAVTSFLLAIDVQRPFDPPRQLVPRVHVSIRAANNLSIV